MTDISGVDDPGVPTAALDHVALVVASLDRSTSFYTSLLGLERLERVILPGHTIQYLGSGTAVQVELIEYWEPADGVKGKADQRAIAMRHMAWNVTELARLEDLTAQLGGEVIARPVFVPELGFTSMLIHDPDGIEAELIQRA